MPSPRQGSAAALLGAPKSAVVTSVEQSIERLEHGIALARIAARGPEPEQAVKYLLTALQVARRHLRSVPPPPYRNS